MRALLARLRAMVDAIPPGGVIALPRDWLAEELAKACGDTPAPGGEAPRRQREPDRLLTPQEVAQKLGCSVRWVYANAHRLPFTVRVGRLVRFRASGLENWLAES
jgi:excisionase family DNA binding protein